MSGFQVGDKVVRKVSSIAWEEKCYRFGYEPDAIFTIGNVLEPDDEDDCSYIWVKEICPNLNNCWDNWDASKFRLVEVVIDLDLDDDDDECI